MVTYRKDFLGWAKVAERIEAENRFSPVKPGAVYWCNMGVGIGHELVGKNTAFTRPCLILARFSDELLFAVPITSQPHTVSNYEKIIVDGKTELLVLPQARPISVLRVGRFIDEIDRVSFNEIRKRYLRFMKYQFYKKVDPD